MKKIFLFVFGLLVLLTGCNTLINTPTKKVEELLSKYQIVDQDISSEVDNLLNDEVTLTSDEKVKYKDIISKQYKNLVYTIKDETVDGDNAIVTVEIEVLDYKKVIDEVDSKYSNDVTLDRSNYNAMKIDALSKAKEKVKYTLEINVRKDKDGNWEVVGLTSSDRKKIQGMY